VEGGATPAGGPRRPTPRGTRGTGVGRAFPLAPWAADPFAGIVRLLTFRCACGMGGVVWWLEQVEWETRWCPITIGSRGHISPARLWSLFMVLLHCPLCEGSVPPGPLCGSVAWSGGRNPKGCAYGSGGARGHPAGGGGTCGGAGVATTVGAGATARRECVRGNTEMRQE